MENCVWGINHIKTIIKELQRYEELDVQLRCLTNLNLRQIVDITKAEDLYIDINGQKVPLCKIGLLMKEMGCNFCTLKNIIS